ncbi:MAG: LPS export ABC transporter permease LptG [Georgfuchsia sp.]
MALKVYERYLARQIYTSTALVLTAFLMLFAFFDLVGEMQDLGRGGYQLHNILAFVVLTLPGRIYELSPIAVLIGTLYAMTTLARHSEITVLRASGLSTAGFISTLLRIGLVFVVLTLVIGELIAPPAERAAQQLRLKAMSSMAAQEFRSGLWVKDERSFVNVRNVQPDTTLRDVRIYEFDPGYRLTSISDASGGVFVAPDHWRLSNVTRTSFDANGKRAQVDQMPELLWKSALNPDILSVLLVKPEKMSVISLYQYIKHLAENQQKTERYVIAMWKKLAYPLTSLVMMILALPFSFLPTLGSTVSMRVFTGIMLGIGFHMLNGLFSNLGVINNWTPLLAAVTPSAIFLFGAGSMLWWVERR